LLGVVHFPDDLSLDDSDPGLPESAPRQAMLRSAASDPSVIVPFVVSLLKSGPVEGMDIKLLAEQGVLSLCIRGLASLRPSMRTACLEALHLLQAAASTQSFRGQDQLDKLLARVLEAVSSSSGLNTQCDAPVSEDDEELPTSDPEVVMDATTGAPRLPATLAIFLSEAALSLLHPSSPIHRLVTRAVGSEAPLNTLPLFSQALQSQDKVGYSHIRFC
jgi:hypothetical protein